MIERRESVIERWGEKGVHRSGSFKKVVFAAGAVCMRVKPLV